MIKIGKTSSDVKNRYNAKTYNTYVFKIRKDDPLSEILDGLKKEQRLTKELKIALEKHLLN